MRSFDEVAMAARCCGLTLIVMGAAIGRVVSAQGADTVATRVPTPAASIRPLMVAGAISLAASATVSLFDARLSDASQELNAHGGATLRHASLDVSSIGGAAPLVTGGTLWLVGRVSHDSVMQQVGGVTAHAVLLSAVLTELTKGLIGRGRPKSHPGDPDMYNPGRGFFDGSHTSFPSGHTSGAFAAATALASQLGGAHPRHRTALRAVFFGAATLVGISRIYQNDHWTSDVLSGAALGVLSAESVLRRLPPAAGSNSRR